MRDNVSHVYIITSTVIVCTFLSPGLLIMSELNVRIVNCTYLSSTWARPCFGTSSNKDDGRWHGANSLRGEGDLSSLTAQWSARECMTAVLKYSTSDLGRSETLDTPTEMSQLKGYQPFVCGCLLLCPLLFLCTNIHFITFSWIEFHGREFWSWRSRHVSHLLSVFKRFYTLANTKQHEQHWYEIINIQLSE
jgi:hypothetical protein